MFIKIGKIFKNFHYKLAALAISSALWFIVQGEEILEINRRIQVDIIVDNRFIIKGPKQTFKDATLRGPRALLGEFSYRPLEAKIEIPPHKLGHLRFRLDKEYFTDWNSRISLTIHDAYVDVFVDEKMTRTVPVKEYFRGIPADGQMIEKTTLKPTAITVTGGKTILKKLSHIMTEPIDIDGISQSKQIDVDLDKESISQFEVSDERIQVAIQVGEKKINRRFSNIPIEVDGSPYFFTVRPRFVTIVLQGTAAIFNGIQNNDLRAFIDARDTIPGKFDKKVSVKIPNDSTLIEVIPTQVSLELGPPARDK